MSLGTDRISGAALRCVVKKNKGTRFSCVTISGPFPSRSSVTASRRLHYLAAIARAHCRENRVGRIGKEVDRAIGIEEVPAAGVVAPEVEQVALFADRARHVADLVRRLEPVRARWAVVLPGQLAAAAVEVDLARAEHHAYRAIPLARGAEPIPEADVVDILAGVDVGQGPAAHAAFAHHQRLAG